VQNETCFFHVLRFLPFLGHCLVDFDVSVDLTNEPKAGEESDRSSQQEEDEDHNHRVAEIQNRRYEAANR